MITQFDDLDSFLEVYEKYGLSIVTTEKYETSYAKYKASNASEGTAFIRV